MCSSYQCPDLLHNHDRSCPFASSSSSNPTTTKYLLNPALDEVVSFHKCFQGNHKKWMCSSCTGIFYSQSYMPDYLLRYFESWLVIQQHIFPASALMVCIIVFQLSKYHQKQVEILCACFLRIWKIHPPANLCTRPQLNLSHNFHVFVRKRKKIDAPYSRCRRILTRDILATLSYDDLLVMFCMLSLRD